MVIFTSPNQIPARTWHPLLPLHHLPPPPEDPLTGGQDQTPPSPVSGEFHPVTERQQQRRRIKQRPECCWIQTSPPGSDGGQRLSIWPVLTLPASQVFPVSPLLPVPSGVDAARTVSLEMESHVKVQVSGINSYMRTVNVWELQMFTFRYLIQNKEEVPGKPHKLNLLHY